MTHLRHFMLRRLFVMFLLTHVFSHNLAAQSTPQLNKKFAKKVSVDVQDEPLGKFLGDLAAEHKVVIEIDNDALAADGFSVDDPITLSLNNVSLFTVVKLTGDSLQLACLPKGAGLALTTRSVADELLYEKQYNLPWLPKLRTTPSDVIHAIQISTSGYWVEIDQVGGVVTSVLPAGFRISQTWSTHLEIEHFFMQCAAIVNGRGGYQGTPSELQILKTLQGQITTAEQTATLQQFLRTTLEEKGVNYWVDRIELSNEGIDPNLMATLVSKTTSISETLDSVLAANNLGFYVEGEVLVITTAEIASEKYIARVYDVRKQIRQVGSPDAVQKVITDTPGTGLWMDNGEIDGGHMTTIGPLLVAYQTRDGHTKIAQMLK